MTASQETCLLIRCSLSAFGRKAGEQHVVKPGSGVAHAFGVDKRQETWGFAC